MSRRSYRDQCWKLLPGRPVIDAPPPHRRTPQSSSCMALWSCTRDGRPPPHRRTPPAHRYRSRHQLTLSAAPYVRRCHVPNDPLQSSGRNRTALRHACDDGTGEATRPRRILRHRSERRGTRFRYASPDRRGRRGGHPTELHALHGERGDGRAARGHLPEVQRRQRVALYPGPGALLERSQAVRGAGRGGPLPPGRRSAHAPRRTG